MRWIILKSIAGALAISASAAADDVAPHQPAAAMCSSTTPTRLPPSIEKVLLKSHRAAKSPFETTTEYAARIASVISATTPARIVAPFRKDAIKFSLKYDAETEILTIRPDLIPHQLDWLEDIDLPNSDQYWFGNIIGGTVSPLHRYTAQNIYGRKVSVTKFERTQIRYVFAGGRQFHQTLQPLQISLPRATAQRSLPDLRIVIEGISVDPYIIDTSDHHDANYYDRVDVTTRLIGITIAPTCGAIVNARLHQVLATFDPSALSLSTEP